MKKLLSICMLVCFTVCICSGMSALMQSSRVSKTTAVFDGYTVVIDAGHGGADAGAIGVTGNHEKDINLAISLRLYDFLRVCGINSILIRDGDYEIYKDGEERTKSDLYNRLDFVNSINKPILVSIHQNHFDDPAEHGSQVWYSANTNMSKLLADSVQNSIKEFLQPENKRENKESDDSYYILYKAIAPSIMVECGFISNPDENTRLQNDRYQKDIAYSIFIGLNKEI